MEYYHACGQKAMLREHHNGYCSWYIRMVDGEAVRYCPRCGKRIWFAHLIHPDDMPKKADHTWEDYLNQQDTLASLRATP